MFKNWTFTETDEEYIKDMEDFISDHVFDIHAHIFKVDNLNISRPSFFLSDGPQNATIKVWQEYVGR